MNNKLFVGNISFKMNEDDLTELFSQSGKVLSVAIPTDRDTGRKRGFAFVEMENDQDAQSAIDQLNGKTIQGREIVVNPSRPKERSFNPANGRRAS
jgi:cold-inducible RNA-binding protein